jgi:hypothetical protein
MLDTHGFDFRNGCQMAHEQHEQRIKDLETALKATVDSIEWMTVRWMRAADIKEAKREVLDNVDLVRDLLS